MDISMTRINRALTNDRQIRQRRKKLKRIKRRRPKFADSRGPVSFALEKHTKILHRKCRLNE